LSISTFQQEVKKKTKWSANVIDAGETLEKVEGRQGIKNRVFVQMINKTAWEKSILDSS